MYRIWTRFSITFCPWSKLDSKVSLSPTFVNKLLLSLKLPINTQLFHSVLIFTFLIDSDRFLFDRLSTWQGISQTRNWSTKNWYSSRHVLRYQNYYNWNKAVCPYSIDTSEIRANLSIKQKNFNFLRRSFQILITYATFSNNRLKFRNLESPDT